MKWDKKKIVTVSILIVFIVFSNTITLAEVTLGEKSALKAATLYFDILPFSYEGIISQLEYDGFTPKEAKYAADNCHINWNEQATRAAKAYLDVMPLSRNALVEQLVFDGYTNEQAKYGADYYFGKHETQTQSNELKEFLTGQKYNWKKGGSFKEEDLLYFYEGEIEWFGNQPKGSYQYFSFDKTGLVVPKDSTGEFSTRRGVQLLDNIEKVLEIYGHRRIMNYVYENDFMYKTLKQANDINYKQLETCKYYFIYNNNHDHQVVFLFDEDEELVFVIYISTEVYEDTGRYIYLKEGYKGVEVSALQTRLAELGYYNFGVDGSYGKRTIEAVENFERCNQLEITGIATVEVQKVLYSSSAASYYAENVQPKAESDDIPEGMMMDEQQWESWEGSGKCKLFPFMSAGKKAGFAFTIPSGQADSSHKKCEFVFRDGENSNELKDTEMYYCTENQSIIYAGLWTNNISVFESDEFKEACIRLMLGYNIGFDSNTGKAVLNLSRERVEEIVNYCLENVERCLVDNMRIRVIRNEDDNYYSFHMEY